MAMVAKKPHIHIENYFGGKFMHLLKTTALLCTILCFSQLSFAQAQSDAATVQSGPAFEIYSGPTEEGPDPASATAPMSLTSSASWSNSAAGPTLYSKNVWYYLKLNPVGAVPSNATIQSVYYSWGLSRKPAGLIVYLCHNSTTTGPCINVTNTKNGSSIDFNLRPANQPLIYAFRVDGSGTLSPPVYGQTDQVIVNYQY